jgi:hypothetical protein
VNTCIIAGNEIKSAAKEEFLQQEITRWQALLHVRKASAHLHLRGALEEAHSNLKPQLGESRGAIASEQPARKLPHK